VASRAVEGKPPQRGRERPRAAHRTVAGAAWRASPVGPDAPCCAPAKSADTPSAPKPCTIRSGRRDAEPYSEGPPVQRLRRVGRGGAKRRHRPLRGPHGIQRRRGTRGARGRRGARGGGRLRLRLRRVVGELRQLRLDLQRDAPVDALARRARRRAIAVAPRPLRHARVVHVGRRRFQPAGGARDLDVERAGRPPRRPRRERVVAHLVRDRAAEVARVGTALRPRSELRVQRRRETDQLRRLGRRLRARPAPEGEPEGDDHAPRHPAHRVDHGTRLSTRRQGCPTPSTSGAEPWGGGTGRGAKPHGSPVPALDGAFGTPSSRAGRLPRREGPASGPTYIERRGGGDRAATSCSDPDRSATILWSLLL
jgi:hypothetical protein